MFFRTLTLIISYALALVSTMVVLRYEWRVWLLHSYAWSFGASLVFSALLLWQYMPQAAFYAIFLCNLSSRAMSLDLRSLVTQQTTGSAYWEQQWRLLQLYG